MIFIIISYLIGTNLFGPLGHKTGRFKTFKNVSNIIANCHYPISLAPTYLGLMATKWAGSKLFRKIREYFKKLKVKGTSLGLNLKKCDQE